MGHRYMSLDHCLTLFNAMESLQLASVDIIQRQLALKRASK
jgi:hypothetical protein